MPLTDDASNLNLTGRWQGLYAYPRRQAPVSFVAMLTETGGWLDGTTEETGNGGDAIGHRLTASLQGRRTGRAVTMLKIYHGVYEAYDSVHYTGEVNDEGTEIAGKWSVPGSWSGTFLMIRPRPAETAVGREAVTQI